MRKRILLLAFLYLMPGFLLGVMSFVQDLKTFDCIDDFAPHGSFMIAARSFTNPNPIRCARRGLGAQTILTIPVLTLMGTPLIVAKIIDSSL